MADQRHGGSVYIVKSHFVRLDGAKTKARPANLIRQERKVRRSYTHRRAQVSEDYHPVSCDEPCAASFAWWYLRYIVTAKAPHVSMPEVFKPIPAYV